MASPTANIDALIYFIAPTPNTKLNIANNTVAANARDVSFCISKKTIKQGEMIVGIIPMLTPQIYKQVFSKAWDDTPKNETTGFVNMSKIIVKIIPKNSNEIIAVEKVSLIFFFSPLPMNLPHRILAPLEMITDDTEIIITIGLAKPKAIISKLDR